MEQRDRDEVLVRFANRSCSVLVASDVAARGIDVEDIGAVVNHELPTDADTYLHRFSRSDRAGRSGLARSLVTPREAPPAQLIEERHGPPLQIRRAHVRNPITNAPLLCRLLLENQELI